MFKKIFWTFIFIFLVLALARTNPDEMSIKEVEESRTEVRENMIDLNETRVIFFIEMILLQRGIYRLSHNLHPSNFSEFMDGFDMGGNIGKIHVNDYGNIELFGYKFIYYDNESFFRLSAEPISPNITGKKWFAVSQKSDGTGYLAEDLNKNGKADPNEPQIKP
jgi:hypothetical protein